MSFLSLLLLLTAYSAEAVVPSWPSSYAMANSTMAMVCNNSGPVDPAWAKPWSIVDIDWNSNKVTWSQQKPQDCEEDMIANINAIKAVNPGAKTWVYRNGVKALPWFTSVRTKLEDPQYWGWFMPYANCTAFQCGPNATTNLYHDFEQTPTGDCGRGVECGEYVFNHLNSSLSSFLLGEYFFGPNGAGNENCSGFYVDDGWDIAGPTEMDSNAVEMMGMTPADVSAMIAAWEYNQNAWQNALVSDGRFLWGLLYGGQQTAPGWNQTDPQSTCQAFHEKNCGPASPSQSGFLFLGFSRSEHSQPWPLPSPEQDLAAFLLTRGSYAAIGYGWCGCADATHPFTRPAGLDIEYGEPIGFCSQTSPGIFSRSYTKAEVSLNCNTWAANITMI